MQAFHHGNIANHSSMAQVAMCSVEKPDGFESNYKEVGNVKDLFPEFTGTRVMMMPFHLHDIDGTIPDSLAQYKPMLKKMAEMTPDNVVWDDNHASYLTIDEMELIPGQIQRNPGKHVDGMYKGEIAGAWGAGGGGWGAIGNGMLIVSNTDNLCSAWSGHFDGTPVNDGDCAHLADQCRDENRLDFKDGQVVWMDGLCVHESYPTKVRQNRQFVRVSMPSASPWFEGYTENPLGIKPNGEIINERRI